ncbi:MAG TPA: glycosyltransferase family 39 protein, partial [Pirellulales bacterium]|nr:glycosyltransferase family 39 protein [Pirellulales bacterium]
MLDTLKASDRPALWWRDTEVWLLVLLVVGVYFVRLPALSIRGEESRRIRIACEMLETGDWIVPRQQGEVMPERPPLANWAIAAAIMLMGDDGPLAARLPSALAVLATTLLIYGYSRSMMSKLGALAAAAGFATMFQVMELGRRAENEALFTCWLAAAILGWHWGYSQRWPVLRTWLIGYVCAALATMVKGPQGPVYFGGAVVAFLVIQRDWRYLLSWQHVAGMAAFAAVLGAWQVPYTMAVGWDLTVETWTREVGKRLHDHSPRAVLGHLLVYPVWIIACMLPWSAFLVAYLRRSVRQSLGPAQRSAAIYLGVAILLAFIPVWLPPGSRARYFMPMYPCFAPLVGIAFDRMFAAQQLPSLRPMWPAFYRTFVGCMLVTSVGSLSCAVYTLFAGPIGGQSLAFLLLLCPAALGLAWITWTSGRAGTPWLARKAMLAILVFISVMFVGVYNNALIAASGHTRSEVVELKQRLPPRVRLASFGQVHHLFAYHFGQTIELRNWPAAGES